MVHRGVHLAAPGTQLQQHLERIFNIVANQTMRLAPAGRPLCQWHLVNVDAVCAHRQKLWPRSMLTSRARIHVDVVVFLCLAAPAQVCRLELLAGGHL